MLRSLRQGHVQRIMSVIRPGYEHNHFTSPIAVIPICFVHRAIKAVLAGENIPGASLGRYWPAWSAAERRADEATRDVEN